MNSKDFFCKYLKLKPSNDNIQKKKLFKIVFKQPPLFIITYLKIIKIGGSKTPLFRIIIFCIYYNLIICYQ